MKSGYHFNISFQMIDCHKQILTFEHESIGNLNANPLNSNQSLSLKSQISQAKAGNFNFINVQINIDPNSTFLLTITLNLYNIMTRKLKKLQNSFILQNLNCSEGEIIMLDKSCFKCPDGSYSSNDFPNQIPETCLNCPTNALCNNGYLIFPQQGYWRRSLNSTLMIACLISEACLLSPNDKIDAIINNSLDINEILNNCKEFHFGNLCNQCQLGFGKSNNNSPCEQCTNMKADQIIRALIIISITILYTLYNSKKIINFNQNSDKIFDIVIKIIINHIQRISIILISEIQFSIQDFKAYVNFLGYINLFDENIISNDCFSQKIIYNYNSEDFYYYKSIIILILPILISTTCFLAFALYLMIAFCKLRRKKVKINNIENITTKVKIFNQKNSIFPQNSKTFIIPDKNQQQQHINIRTILLKKFVLFFLIVSFLCYPLLIKSSMNLLNCISIDNFTSETFLYQSPNVRCWIGIHRYAAAPTGIIGLVAWGIIFPLLLWKLIKVSLEMKENPKKKMKNNQIFDEKTFQFFFKDYKKEYYYWESIVFIQKLILNIFSQMKLWTEDNYSRLCNIIFLIIFFHYVHKFQPFSLKSINLLEFISIFATLLTNTSTIGLSSLDIPVFLKITFILAIIGTNIIFFVTAFIVILRETKWKKIFIETKKNLKKIRHSLKSLIENKQ